MGSNAGRIELLKTEFSKTYRQGASWQINVSLIVSLSIARLSERQPACNGNTYRDKGHDKRTCVYNDKNNIRT